MPLIRHMKMAEIRYEYRQQSYICCEQTLILMKHIASIVSLLLLCIFLPCTKTVAQFCPNNLVHNPSFDFFDWSWKFSGAKIVASEAEFCQYGQRAHQIVPCSGGMYYTAKFRSKAQSTPAQMGLRFRFRSATGAIIQETQTLRQVSAMAYTDNTYSVLANQGAKTLEIIFSSYSVGCTRMSDVCLIEESPCTNDMFAPIISGCPAAKTVFSPTGVPTAVFWTVPTATDNCPGVQLTSNYMSGDTFPLGTTQVLYTATDGSQFTSTCTFEVTVRKSDSECTGNLIFNPDFDLGLDYWQFNQATPFSYQGIQVVTGGVELHLAGSFIRQRVEAKPFYSYHLNIWGGNEFTPRFTFMDANGNILSGQPAGGQAGYLQVSPEFTAFVEITISADTAVTGKQIYNVCLTEVPAFDSYFSTPCPMIQLQGNYAFIGYDSTTNYIELAKQTSPSSWNICSMDSLGKLAYRDEAFAIAHEVIIKDSNRLLEVDELGDTVLQRIIPTQVLNKFWEVQGAFKSGDAYFMWGYDGNPAGLVQFQILKLDTLQLNILVEKKHPAITYPGPYQNTFGNGKMIEMYNGLIGFEITGGPSSIGSLPLDKFRMSILSVKNLTFQNYVKNWEGEFNVISPGVVRIISRSAPAGSQGHNYYRDTLKNYRFDRLLPYCFQSEVQELTVYPISNVHFKTNVYTIKISSDSLHLYVASQENSSYNFHYSIDLISELYNAKANSNGKISDLPYRNTHRVYAEVGTRLVEIENADSITTIRTLSCNVQNPPMVSCSQNLLANASFQQDLQGWINNGGIWSAGNLQLCQVGQTLTQTLAAEPGQHYRFHYTAQTLGSGQNVFFGLKFLDANWQVLATQYSSFDSPGNFSSNNIELSAPASAKWVEVAIIKENSGCIDVSEVCLTDLPPVAVPKTRVDQNSDPNDQTDQSHVYLSPNPTTSRVEVHWSAKAAQLTLIDLSGKVLEQKKSSSQTWFDLSAYGDGLYFVRLDIPGERTRVLKVLLVR